MKKSKIGILLLGCILLTLIIAIPVIARTNNQYKSSDQDFHVSLDWAVYDDDLFAFDLIIEGDFSVPVEFIPISCPVSKVLVLDSVGNEITGETTTSCRLLDDNTHILTQFFYGDFTNTTPGKIEVHLGDLELSPVAFVDPGHMPLIGVYTFGGPFGQSTQISAFPDENVKKNGLSLSVERADFTPSLVKVDACIALPDNGDWIPSTSLIMDNEIIEVDEWLIPNFRENPDVFEKSDRCYVFLAHTGVKDFRDMGVGDISFVLDKVSMNVAERLSAEDMEKVKMALTEYDLPLEPDASGYYSLASLYGGETDDSGLDMNERTKLLNLIREVLSDPRHGPLVVPIR